MIGLFSIEDKSCGMSRIDNQVEPLLYERLELFAAARIHYAVNDKASSAVEFFGHVTRVAELRGIIDALRFHLGSIHISLLWVR
jgi:hypothetical protein